MSPSAAKSGPHTGIRSLGLAPEIGVVSVCLLVSAFILFLYAIIFLGSLVKVWGVDYSPTFEHYDYVFNRGMKAIKDTVLIALVVTPIGAILGTAFGYITSRMRFPRATGHGVRNPVKLCPARYGCRHFLCYRL